MEIIFGPLTELKFKKFTYFCILSVIELIFWIYNMQGASLTV